MRAGDNARSAGPAAEPATAPAAGIRQRVPAAVLALGMVSLVTDVSAEMITATMGLYLTAGLGLGYLALGAMDGLYTGATALLRLGGGYAADRLGRPKHVATLGYGVSAVCKLGFPAVGGSVTGLSAVVMADRAGKGVRTAPRDAMITHATPTEGLGRAFGVHRAMDTCGALLGPLVAFFILWAIPGGYDVVFFASFCIAAVGVVVLVLFVPNAAGVSAAGRARVSLRRAVSSMNAPAIRRMTLAAGLLGLMTAGDLFFFVAVQRQLGLPSQVLPLLPLGTALVFMLAAIPIGRLADRVGRWSMFVGGHVVLVAAYLVVAGSLDGWVFAAVALCLHGVFYAATDGVLMAYAGPAIPAEVRATGLAVVQTAQALARAGGAVLLGALAASLAVGTAFLVFAAGLALAAVLAATRLAARGSS
ncbi:MFS transporter [Nocardioides speluncae]|uniref:MFS transporter n=1 Tax=Nocardioides speluncae TaxID=2670337 RepID=UPI001F0C9CF3|nr:MFS transporter [Nocardioides speluncae]